MRQIPTIALNAFMELVRQPVFLLLFTISPLIMIILAAVPYFGFGGTDMGPVNFDIKMVKDGALTVMFVSGLFAAVICASSSLSREVSTGTALAVLAKPVGRMHFIIGKYLGIVVHWEGQDLNGANFPIGILDQASEDWPRELLGETVSVSASLIRPRRYGS